MAELKNITADYNAWLLPMQTLINKPDYPYSEKWDKKSVYDK